MLIPRFLTSLWPLKARALVLMYHRVHSPDYDPWQLSVSAENFRDQIQCLKSDYNIISLTKLIGQLKTNSFTDNAICVTFDDTYKCNFEIAKPILEEYSCDATFFAPSKFISERKAFWWDVLTELVFNTPVLPEILQLTSPLNFHFRFKEHAKLNLELVKKHRSWLGEEQPVSERCKLFLELNNLFKPAQFDLQEQLLEVLLDWANLPLGKIESLAMTCQQLKMTSESPVIAIGLHTSSHLALGLHSAGIQQTEIAENEIALTEMGVSYNNVLAYPYGNYNSDTIRIAESCGMAAAFTTDPIAVTERSNHYRLGRFLVPDINGSSFRKQLKLWAKQRN
jgi:peptidoglycan/xylan/chitin deacetylase (PgdA/CDA1 family)